jgi:hypothetical protein
MFFKIGQGGNKTVEVSFIGQFLGTIERLFTFGE